MKTTADCTKLTAVGRTILSVFSSATDRIVRPTIETIVLLLLAMMLAGCRQQMADQPAYRPLQASGFFADGQSARPLVAGTVPRGEAQLETQFYTGLNAGHGDEALTVARTDLAEKPYVREFPIPMSEETLHRGQQRFMVFCAPCHDSAGTGHGVVVQRGFTQPPSYHSDRLRSAPPGYFFDVISRGYGSMPDYRTQIPPKDRWAIAGYLRVLQESAAARQLDRQLNPSPTSTEARDGR